MWRIRANQTKLVCAVGSRNGTEETKLIVLDFDGDKDMDAATCAFGSKEAYWFENDGKGQFTRHLVAKDQEAYDIRAADLDGDDDLDILIAGRRSNNVVWYENPK